MRYTVIIRPSVSGLTTAVNEYIKAGWEPLGGLAYARTYRPELDVYDEIFLQAMIKP